MSKTFRNLSQEEQQRLFYILCLSLVKIRDAGEAAEFLQDLFSPQEVEMIARRLKIAELLLQDFSYEEIHDRLGSGNTTTARVQEWLRVSGEGYRRAVEKIRAGEKDFLSKQDIVMEKRIMDEKKMGQWGSIKHKYPMYYWPQLLLEEVVENSNKRQLKKIESVLRQMEKVKKKPIIYGQIRQLLRKRKYKS